MARRSYANTLAGVEGRIFVVSSGHDLYSVFRKIDPARRQFYANFIRRAELGVLEENKQHIEAVKECLENITFPRLKCLRLRVPGWNWDGEMEIPLFRAPQLTSLEIDPRFEINPDTFAVTQDEWEKVLEYIPVSRFYFGIFLSLAWSLCRLAFRTLRPSDSSTVPRSGQELSKHLPGGFPGLRILRCKG